MLADPEDVEARSLGGGDLLHEVAQPLQGRRRAPQLGERVDADLHGARLLSHSRITTSAAGFAQTQARTLSSVCIWLAFAFSETRNETSTSSSPIRFTMEF